MANYLRDTGVPLGGIGAGKVDLCPDGAFRNVTIQNNLDWPYSGDGDQVDLLSGRKTKDWAPGGLSEAFFAAAVEGAGGTMLKVEDRKDLPGVALEDIGYEGRYPFARLTYPTLGEVALQLDGFAPLLLDDPHPQYLNSSLPTSVFTLTATNTSDQPKRVGLAFSFPQIVGMGGLTHCRITDPRGNTTTEASSDRRAEIRYGHSKAKINKRVEGEIAIAALANDGTELTTTNGWWYKELFETFAASQALPAPQGEAVVLTDAGAIHQGSMGAVGATRVLQPGENWSQRFVLAWHFPDRPCNDGPKAYRNMYARFLDDVDAVLDYVQDNLAMLEDETRRWHDCFDASNLPAWLTAKLCNNISHFSTGSIYCDDGRGSFNESPIIMNGCMGTIDQRLASHGPCTIAFPDIARSELEMFVDTQIGDDDPQRYAPHWNQTTGQFDATLDRAGAVKHNIGRDDFEGGKTDHTKWLTTHWPDRIPSFVLELYMQAAWTGDRAFLERVYPNILAALDFQKRLDQNGDGIGDLWYHGCCSFDSRRFQICGASPYIGSLYLAGLRCAQKIARILGDEERIPELQADFDQAQQTMENEIWNEAKGQYDKWVDPWHANWDGTDRAHGPRSDVRMTAQLAGAWFVPMLDLEPILDQQRIERALDGLYTHNVAPFAGAMCNETGGDHANQQSWPYYGETFYAAPAIMAGKVDQGMDMEERFAKAMDACGRHWDLPLSWGGPQMDEPGWGRWYMSTPASWFVLQALTGVWYDGLTQTLTVRPRRWSQIGELHNVPIFHPLFWGTVSTDADGWTLAIIRLRTDKVTIDEWLSDGSLTLSCDENLVELTGTAGRHQGSLIISQPCTLRGRID